MAASDHWGMPPLRREDEWTLLLQYETGNEMTRAAAAERIIRANMRFVCHAALQVTRARGMPPEDCIQAGNLALVEALSTFDSAKVRCPERFRFISYASKAIRGAILRQAGMEEAEAQYLRLLDVDEADGAEDETAFFLHHLPGTPTDPTAEHVAAQELVADEELQALLASLKPQQQAALLAYAEQIVIYGETTDQAVAKGLGTQRSAITRMKGRIKLKLSPYDRDDLLAAFRTLMAQIWHRRATKGSPHA